MHSRRLIGQGRLVCYYFVISFYLLMRGQVSIVQKDFDNAITSDAILSLFEMYTTLPMALEYLAYYFVPARGCGNKPKAFFRHLAGPIEEGGSTSPSIPEERDDVQLWSQYIWRGWHPLFRRR